MKVTDKDSQKLVVITMRDHRESWNEYDLSGLTVNDS